MKNAYDKLDGTEINGRKIKLIEDRPKRRRYEGLVYYILVPACFGENYM